MTTEKTPMTQEQKDAIVAKRKETQAALKAKAEELKGQATINILAVFGLDPESDVVKNTPAILENLMPKIEEEAMKLAKAALGKAPGAPRAKGKTAWDRMKVAFQATIGRLLYKKISPEGIRKLFEEALESPKEYTQPKPKAE